MAKKYFWLKLKSDFFEQKEIKMLRRIAGGDTYTIIYLKMLLVSLKNEGKVYYDGIANNMVDEIALEIDEDAEDVQICFNYLRNKGLIEFNTDDEIELTNIASMIGSETDKAAMMRRLRKQRKQESIEKSNNVTEALPDRYTEIEIEKELEIEKEKELQLQSDTDQQSQSLSNDYSEISNFYQNNFGVLSNYIAQDLSQWLDDLNKDLVIRAMQKAIEGGKNYSYAKGIMKNWAQNNIKTLEDAEAEEKSFRNKGKKTNSEPRYELEWNE